MKKTILCFCFLLCIGAIMPAAANDAYDAGYQQGYADAANDSDHCSDAAPSDYCDGYAAGQKTWHQEHDKTWGQQYDEIKEDVETAQNAAETAQQWKDRLDQWAQHDDGSKA